MPKIDFYIIPESDAKTRLLFACRLIEKAYQNKHRIYIHTENQQEAHQLDELLWTYREDSFLPHNLYGEGPDPAPPIQIGYSVVPEKQRDILLNLNKQVPEFFTNFNRVLEIVSSDATLQAISREHYRYYKTQGHEINTHKLASMPEG